MAEGRKEATHSLITEIEMMFKSEGAVNLTNDINAISDSVVKMTEPVKQLTKAFEELNASPVNDLVKTLENFSLDSVAVDASSLRRVLENKIASAITKSKIEFIGDEGTERYPFKISMGANFWEKNQRNIIEAMAKAFSNFEVDVKDIPPLDNRMILEEFQKKFNEQIVELIKDEEVFSLFREDPNTKVKKFRYKRRFSLDREAVDEIMGAIEKEFVRVLSDPNNIFLEDIPKLKIKSTELKQAMLRIQDSIGDIDSLLGVEADALKDLPDIEDKLLKFRNNLNQMIREINILAGQLESITIGRATEEDVKQTIQTIDKMKESTTLQLNEWIKDVALIVDSHMQVRPDLSNFKGSISDLNSYFETVFQKQLDIFKEDVGNILKSIQTKDGGEERDLLEGKSIDITQAILDVITEGLLNQEIPIELDLGLLEEMLMSWSGDFNVTLNKQLYAVLNDIVENLDSLLENIKNRIESMFDSIDIAISMVLQDEEPLFSINELSKTLSIIQEEVYNYVVNTILNTSIVGYKSEDLEFELPKSFRRDIKQIVDKNIREYSRGIVENYKSAELEGAGVKESVERLNRHTTMIINAVMREVNQTLTDTRKEFLYGDSGWTESTKNLKSVFERNIRSLAGSYIKTLEDSINTIILTEESLVHLQDQIAEQIIDRIKVSKIEVEGQETILNLDEVYMMILKQISDELRESLSSWSPNVPINEGIDVEKISRRLTEMVNGVLEQKVKSWIDNIKYDDRTSEISISSEELNITELLYTVTKGIEDTLQKQFDNLISMVGELDDEMYGIDITSIMNRIDSLIEEAVLNRIEKIAMGQIEKDGLKIDLTKPTKKALREMEKTINAVTDMAIGSIKDEEVGEVELNLKTKRLQNNINSLIQKIVNEKSKQITVFGNQLASEAGIEDEYLLLLKESIDSLLDNMVAGYAIAVEKLSSHMYSDEEVSTIYSRMINGFTESFSIVIDSFLDELDVVSRGQLSVSTSKIHPKIKKAMADSQDMNVREFVKAFPEIEGDEAQRVLIRKNVELIINAVNDIIQTNVRQVVTAYEDSVKQIDVEPDKSLVDYIYDRLMELQDSIVTSAKKMVREQFRYLTEEIKQMNVEARSMGYKPTKAYVQEVSKATGRPRTRADDSNTLVENILGDAEVRIDNASMRGADVLAHGLHVNSTSVEIPNINELVTNTSSVVVDGHVVDLNVDKFPVDKIVTPIQNLLTTQLPFSTDPEITPYISDVLKGLTSQHFLPSNIYGRGYSPFNIDKILFKKDVEPYKGLFEGITSNMAKYFMVGYMMRLPIKAVTEANKVAAELDYHLAKARQNILIKDPQMTTTAQRIIYDRYQAEGRDVGSKEFREDVNKEAASLRSIISNQMSDHLLNISKAYYQEIADVGRYYSIASRRSRDPYEALTKTREIAKIAAVEEDLDTDFAATGLEALSAQWGVDIAELDRYTNMLLKTAMLSNVTVTDLLMTQRDTAAMFKSRLTGLEDEEAFASAMALSSMFVQATGKSGREAGTFWRNVLQRPYVKDSRKFLEQAAQHEGFEMLSPYYVNEMGEKVQKDFITMFSDILEATLKVDDPSAMTILSEIFPIRTIGGTESVAALVQDLKWDLIKSVEMLKDMGELDEDASIDTVNIKEVIDKYIENIMEVTDEDIGMYLAGLQDTTQFAYTGMYAQWQSTVYSIFRELKEEASSAMTYLTAILRKFEENSHHLSEVIGIFMKIGLSYLSRDMINRIIQRGTEAPTKPTDVQREIASKYMELEATEKSLDLRREAVEGTLTEYSDRMVSVDRDITRLQDERHQLHIFIQDIQNKKKLTEADRTELSKAIMQRDMYDDQLIKLRNTYNQLEQEVHGLSTRYEDIMRSYSGTIELGSFLKGSMGARTVDDLKDSFANYIRNKELYIKIAPLSIKSTMGQDDLQYDQLHRRKAEIEDVLLSQQRNMFKYFVDTYEETSDEVLREILGDKFGDSFHALENRLTEETVDTMRQIGKHMEFDTEYAKMRKGFERTYRELNAINSELIDLNMDRYEVKRAIFEATRPKIVGYSTVEGERIPQTAAKTTEEIIESYRGLLPAFGVNIDQFESGMDKLAAMFKDGQFNVDGYEDSLRDVAKQLGIADRDFEKFKLTVRDLNNEIKLGKKDIYEYITALEAASTKSGKLKVGAVGRDVEESDASKLDSTSKAALGLGALSVAGKGAAKDGLFSKLWAKLGGTALGSGLSKVGTKLGASKLGVFGKGLAVGVKGLFAKIPHLAALYVGVSALGSVMGGLTDRSMTDAERLLVEADKLESQIKKATGWKINEGDSPIARLGKRLGVEVGSGWHGLMNQLNKWAGGTAPSFKETRDIWKEVLKHPGLARDELITQMKEGRDVELKRYKANYERQQEYLNKNPFIDPLTGKLRDKGDPQLGLMPLEDLMEFLDRRMKDLNKILTESDALFTKEKVRLLISGLSNNSTEMRKAIKEHLNRNVDEMTRLVDEFKEYLPRLVPGSEAYTAMQLQIMDLENKITETELQKFETDFSEFDEIMERYNRQSSLIQSRYDIKKYDAVLSGIKSDSSAIKQIEKKMAEEQVKMMSSIQSRLEGLKQQYADKPDQREKILIQIQQLEADKKRILADIKDKMSEGLSTFNLPSDIKPITYYEAMTRNNTHRNVTVRAGDAIVNVNIDNMSGSDADMERLSKAVSDAVAQAQKNFVRQFANDVKSGMGNNYYSWNNY